MLLTKYTQIVYLACIIQIQAQIKYTTVKVKPSG